MARTPEGKVKQRVNAYLNSLGYDCFYFMPVQTGYGRPSLDYVGGFKGKAFAIETKSANGSLTPMQQITIERMRRAGIEVFVVAGVDEVEKLKPWFQQ